VAAVALTNINHNGEWVDAGDEIPEEWDEDTVDALTEQGAIGEPTLTGSEAEAFAQARLAEVDELLQEKYNITLADVLATEDTGEEPSEEDSSSGGTYESMTQEALHEELSSRGLAVSGTKNEQVARLEEDDASADRVG
jgi:hypothetical protein